MSNLPDAPVSPDCDCTDLDSFMLNVERLMASELVALSTHEVVGAALFLWCRAWKQIPAASLPDDDRVLAAYSKLPKARFAKLRNEVLRGFVKCLDGRLYHRVLAIDAMKAFEKKKAFQAKRATDSDRLRKWRQSHKGTSDETSDETRFVPEGQGQGQVRDRDNKKEREGEANASGAAAPRQEDVRKSIFDTGVRILVDAGTKEPAARKLLGKWCKNYGDKAVLTAIDMTVQKGTPDPISFITGCLKAGKPSDDGKPRTAVEVEAQFEAEGAWDGVDYR